MEKLSGYQERRQEIQERALRNGGTTGDKSEQWKGTEKERPRVVLLVERRDLECFKSFPGGCQVEEERGASGGKEK